MISVFTSESATCGHPDKICDQIADAVLDDILSHDEKACVSCEVTACEENIHIMGKITAAYTPDYDTIARSVISGAGYDRPDLGFDARNCYVHPQSSDFSRIINCRHEEDMGAGSQCVVSGYACDETPEGMPLPITLANRLSKELQRVRQEQIIPYLLPDGTAQVCVAYQNGKPFRLSTVVISAQHRADAGTDSLREAIDRCVVRSSMPSDMIDAKTDIYINPTGSFVTGGPAGCSGMTGR